MRFSAGAEAQRVGVFQFSPERAPGRRHGDQVDPEAAARRVELVVDLQSRIWTGTTRAAGNRDGGALRGFDSEAGCYAGRTYADSVDIDGRVLLPPPDWSPRGNLSMCAYRRLDGDLTGEIEDEGQ